MIRHNKFTYENTTKRIALPFVAISLILLIGAGGTAYASGRNTSPARLAGYDIFRK